MTDSHSYPETAELARKAALFREGTKRIYEGQGASADMWYFELFHFLDDVEKALSGAQSTPVQAIADDCRSAAATWRRDMPAYATRNPDGIAEIYDRIADSLDRALAVSSTARAILPGHDETMANLDALTIKSADPRCTCAAIVNPNIPHARTCPLFSTHCACGITAAGRCPVCLSVASPTKRRPIMSWRQGAGKCEPSEQTLALMDQALAKTRNAVIEECAKVAESVQLRMHEECDFGAGIAAREIRALAVSRPHSNTPGDSK